jgi:bacteriorhodopsin
MFPILFILGREAFGHITYYGSNIGHFILELFSKNLVRAACSLCVCLEERGRLFEANI